MLWKCAAMPRQIAVHTNMPTARPTKSVPQKRKKNESKGLTIDKNTDGVEERGQERQLLRSAGVIGGAQSAHALGAAVHEVRNVGGHCRWVGSLTERKVRPGADSNVSELDAFRGPYVWSSVGREVVRSAGRREGEGGRWDGVAREEGRKKGMGCPGRGSRGTPRCLCIGDEVVGRVRKGIRTQDKFVPSPPRSAHSLRAGVRSWREEGRARRGDGDWDCLEAAINFGGCKAERSLHRHACIHPPSFAIGISDCRTLPKIKLQICYSLHTDTELLHQSEGTPAHLCLLLHYRCPPSHLRIPTNPNPSSPPPPSAPPQRAQTQRGTPGSSASPGSPQRRGCR